MIDYWFKHYRWKKTPKAGCQTFLVTDPVGDVILWKRGCSNQLPTGSQSNICTTEYVHGSYRIDSCVCNRFLCNGSSRNQLIITSSTAITLIPFVIKLTTSQLFYWLLLFNFTLYWIENKKWREKNLLLSKYSSLSLPVLWKRIQKEPFHMKDTPVTLLLCQLG